MAKTLIQSTGRRKAAIARVRIDRGEGKIIINGKPMEEYLTSLAQQQMATEPLRVVGVAGDYDLFISVLGGGIAGQAGAIRLGISRALCEVDADLRPALKKAGFLTRDAREKESKKYGLKKARKAPQFSKR
ncbi:MAG: 30S ribosomal protein S9 [Acidimicrobiaceae bacterium]|nr:30S ribosomal protein S9 [Acidimicrobiaceae bacterium]